VYHTAAVRLLCCIGIDDTVLSLVRHVSITTHSLLVNHFCLQALKLPSSLKLKFFYVIFTSIIRVVQVFTCTNCDEYIYLCASDEQDSALAAVYKSSTLFVLSLDVN